MNKVETWCPIFSGFYNTYWEINDDYLIACIEEDAREKGYTHEHTTKLCNALWSTKLYEELSDSYRKNVCTFLVEQLEAELKKSGFITQMKMEELISPREYNFVNDSINVVVTVSKKNILAIEKYIAAHADEWREYIKKRYTSYDGFMSSHSNNIQDDEWQVKQAMEDTHNAGSLLNFILLLENGGEDFEFSLYDTFQGNNSISITLEELEEAIVVEAL